MDKEMFSSTTQNYDSWFWPRERVKFFTVAVRGQNLELCGLGYYSIHSHHCQGQKHGTLASRKRRLLRFRNGIPQFSIFT